MKLLVKLNDQEVVKKEASEKLKTAAKQRGPRKLSLVEERFKEIFRNRSFQTEIVNSFCCAIQPIPGTSVLSIRLANFCVREVMYLFVSAPGDRATEKRWDFKFASTW